MVVGNAPCNFPSAARPTSPGGAAAGRLESDRPAPASNARGSSFVNKTGGQGQGAGDLRPGQQSLKGKWIALRDDTHTAFLRMPGRSSGGPLANRLFQRMGVHNSLPPLPPRVGEGTGGGHLH